MLTLYQIKKTFNPDTPDALTLFDGFDLAVEDGEFVSIVGSNGSGKTTILNIICGSIEADGGAIQLDGKDLAHMPEYKRYNYIGRVYQDPSKGNCPGMTILENMSIADNKGKQYGLGRGVNKRRIDFYRSQLELLDMGLENKLNTPVGLLSGGQRQALSMIISTMHPIELLILDEHTAALDPKVSETIMQLTGRIVKEKGITTLMVTHNLRYAVEYGSRLLMMHEGKAVMDKNGEEKQNMGVDDILALFTEISIELGN